MKVFLITIFFIFCSKGFAQFMQSSNFNFPENQPLEFPSIYISVVGRLNAVDKVPATYRLADALGSCAIELHGNSTLNVAKKSYDFSFRSEGGLSIAGKFPGLPWTKDLLFVSNFYDPSMLRNALAYSTWEALGHKTPEYAFCHVYVNEVYEGIYLVVEKIRSLDQLIDKSQWKPESTTLKQPFFMRIDGENEGQVPIVGMRDYPIYAELLDPKPYKNGMYDQSFRAFFEEVNSALNAIVSNELNPISYADHIDIESFVDFFLLNEWTKNPDAYHSSVFFYSNEKGKLTMGPVWDFDLAFANPLNPEDDDVEGWMYQKKFPKSTMKTMPSWWYLLMCDPSFRRICLDRLVIIESWVNSESFYESMRSQSRGLEAKMSWEIKRWGRPTEFTTIPGPLLKTIDEELEEMVLFLRDRLVWMKGNLLNQPCISPFSVMAEYDEYIEVLPDTVIHEFNIQFDEDLSGGLNLPGSRYQYYSDYTYTLLDDRGNERESGKVTGSSLSLRYVDWPVGTYYLVVTERSGNSMVNTSAPFLMQQFKYKLIVLKR
jgi:hypothetical protein